MSALTDLARLLGRIFPERVTAKLAAQNAGIPIELVDLDGPPAAFWTELLRQAVRDLRLNELCGHIIQEAPAHAEAVKQLSHDIAGGNASHGARTPGASWDPCRDVGREALHSRIVRMLAKSNNEPVAVSGPRWIGKSWLIRRVIHTLSSIEPSPTILDFGTLKLSPDQARSNYQSITKRFQEIWSGAPEAITDAEELRSTLYDFLEFKSDGDPLVIITMKVSRSQSEIQTHAALFDILRDIANTHRHPWTRVRLLLELSSADALTRVHFAGSIFSPTDIPVNDFTISERESLARCYGVALSENDNLALDGTVGGHPWLNAWVFNECAENPSLTPRKVLRETGRLWNKGTSPFFVEKHRLLSASPKLLSAFREVASSEHSPRLDYELSLVMQDAGLIREVGNPPKWTVRYPILRDFVRELP